MPTAKRITPSLTKEEQDTLHFVIAACEDYYKVDRGKVISESRTPSVIKARHAAMYYARLDLKHSFPKIGKFFKRDHSTVMSAVGNTDALELTDLFEHIDSLLANIHEADDIERELNITNTIVHAVKQLEEHCGPQAVERALKTIELHRS